MVACVLVLMEWCVRVRAESPDAKFWSDSSGSWGCGALWGGLWLQVQWVPGSELALASIAAKEFLPIFVSAPKCRDTVLDGTYVVRRFSQCARASAQPALHL